MLKRIGRRQLRGIVRSIKQCPEKFTLKCYNHVYEIEATDDLVSFSITYARVRLTILLYQPNFSKYDILKTSQRHIMDQSVQVL